jgi:hypothetical protein
MYINGSIDLNKIFRKKVNKHLSTIKNKSLKICGINTVVGTVVFEHRTESAIVLLYRLLLIIFSFIIHQTEVLCQLERAAGKPSGRAGRWRLSEFVFPALDGVASSSLEHVFVVR